MFQVGAWGRGGNGRGEGGEVVVAMVVQGAGGEGRGGLLGRLHTRRVPVAHMVTPPTQAYDSGIRYSVCFSLGPHLISMSGDWEWCSPLRRSMCVWFVDTVSHWSHTMHIVNIPKRTAWPQNKRKKKSEITTEETWII